MLKENIIFIPMDGKYKRQYECFLKAVAGYLADEGTC